MTAEVFRYPLVEIYTNDWHDITEDVRYGPGVVITRGRGDEDDSPPPQTCRLTLHDPNGDYQPRNAMGAHYGLIGRNTPLRVSLVLASHTFGTPVTGGWGGTDDVDGQTVYTWSRHGGAACDYDVAGGVGTHELAAAGDVRVSYLGAVDLREVELRCTVTVPTSDITGGGIAAANLVLRGQSVTDYYHLRVVIGTDESVSVDFMDAAGVSITDGATTVPGLVHSSAQPLRVAFGAEGRALRCKVWATTDREPAGWTRVHVDEDPAGDRATLTAAPGWVGIRTELLPGNTNGPIAISYDDVEVRSPRFAGEVSTWPPRRDITGTDRTVSITASGIRRRGAQGAANLHSPLRQYIQSGVSPVAYWPLEDKTRQVAEEVLAAAGRGHLTFVPPTAGTTAGRVSWAADSTLPGSDALAALTGGGSLVGRLSPSTSEAGWSLTWCQRMSVTDGSFSLFSTTSGVQLAAILDPATPTVLTVYLTGPGVSGPILTHNFASREDVEQWHLYQLNALQSGSDAEFLLSVDGDIVDGYSIAAFGVGGLYYIQISSPTNAGGNTGVGHVVVDYSVPGDALVAPFGGHVGETAGARMIRLCGEQQIEFDWIGPAEDTPQVGPQGIATLLAHLDETADVDGGLLYEQRGRAAYCYRTRRSLYSQTAAVTLDYAANEIAPPWAPVDDDRYLRNDITVQRKAGGSYRHEVTEGRLSTAPVEEGGAGRYRDSPTLNVRTDSQLPGIAQWRGHLGTVDETRYPAVVVHLHGHALRGNAAKQSGLLDLDLGDLVHIANVEAEADGTGDDTNQLAIGYTEVITDHQHRLALVLAPASPYRALVLDDDEYGRADSVATALDEDLDETETSVQVQIDTGSALWTTDPADWPFDVVVGGEVMTVTAVAGSSSPQTFTVTRSINGVVKTHPSLAPVHLARPVYAGL